MGKSQSKHKYDDVCQDDSRDLKKISTRRLKIGVKFGKDTDGGIEAGLACGLEKKVDRVFGPLVTRHLPTITEDSETTKLLESTEETDE